MRKFWEIYPGNVNKDPQSQVLQPLANKIEGLLTWFADKWISAPAARAYYPRFPFI